MAAFDNVSLPGPPNGAQYITAAGNLAKQLSDMFGGLGDAYQSGQKFGYEQRQRNLFQNGLPTDSSGNLDYAAMLKKMLQSGGASSAGSLMPAILAQQGAQVANNAFNGGMPVNAPAQSTSAAGPANITAGGGGGAPSAPRISYAQPSDLSGSSDNTGRNPNIHQMAVDSGVDPTSPQFKQAFAGIDTTRDLTNPSVINAAQTRIDQLKSSGAQPMGSASTGGISSPAVTQANPVPQAGVGEDEGNTNQGTPVGTGGGSPISPVPTSASGAIAETPGASFNQRFGAATGAPAKAPERVAQAVQPAQAQGGPPSEAEIENYRARGENMLRASTSPVVSAQQATALRDAGNKNLDIAKQLREQRDKWFEPTPEQKNVASGTERQKLQIAADTKYYDSLHRGLAGSGMIAAQQKQNIDILRQVAASPNFVPGAGSDLALSYQRLAAQFGINPTGAAPREIFNQVSARILADQFSGMKSMASETGEQGGRLFKSMLDIEEKANITSADSIDGIKSKLDIIDRTGNLMMRWADMADNYKIKHGQLDAGFDKELRADIAKGRVPNVVPKPPATSGRLAPGKYIWTPDGLRPAQ